MSRTTYLQRPFLSAGVNLVVACALLVGLTGCYAPLHSPGIDASTLPESYRASWRAQQPRLNFGSLVAPPPPEYLLGPGDILQLIVPNLFAEGDALPFQVGVLDDGTVRIPGAGVVPVAGCTLAMAHDRVNKALDGGILKNPDVSIQVLQKGTVSVLVLGEVTTPGVHLLPRFENDIGHALALAGGFGVDAGDYIEVHRRGSWPHGEMSGNATAVADQDVYPPRPIPMEDVLSDKDANPNEPIGDSVGNAGHSMLIDGAQPALPQQPFLRIPLRGFEIAAVAPNETVLNSGDVIVVPPAQKQVFYVVGNPSRNQGSRFAIGDAYREIGVGFLLPRDRDIDILAAVAMAGHIDPIESPTTVTVHRQQPGCAPMQIRVDLLEARTNPQENVVVQPGDIIYLNPDAPWWWRRTLDRVIDTALGRALVR